MFIFADSIGGQQFSLIFDTGSSDLVSGVFSSEAYSLTNSIRQWVVLSSCFDEDCLRIPKYLPSSALTLLPTAFNVTYLTGSVTGVVGYETVTFGAFEIFSQVLGIRSVFLTMHTYH